jgi:ribosome biogenesis GTPase A
MSENKNSSGNLVSILITATEEIISAGKEYSEYSKKLSEMRERLDHGQINLAVLGQLKRGKSTLLNALLGEKILPSSVIPLTSVPIYIKYGKEKKVCIHLKNERECEELKSNLAHELHEFLSHYVSEEKNPKNRLEVKSVELYHDLALLRKGVVLIDTPGIGSTHFHNTETTLDFLPHCDAALFIVSVDPPITETELHFLAKVEEKTGRIFFIINKIDYLTESESDKVSLFMENVLKERAVGCFDFEIFKISAKNAFEGRIAGNQSLINSSRIGLLKKRLDDFVCEEKHTVLNSVLSGKALTIMNDLLMHIEICLKAYRMPVEEIENKLQIFIEKINEAEKQVSVSSDILTGERKRLLEFLEEQSEQLRQSSKKYLTGILTDSLEKKCNENEIRKAFSEVIPVFFEQELGRLSEIFDRKVTEIMAENTKLASDIIASVRKNAADIFNIANNPNTGIQGIEFKSEPYWVVNRNRLTLMPVPDTLLEKFMPRKMAEKRLKRRLEYQVNEIVISNVENIRWATLQNLDLTFRKFTVELKEQFDYIVSATRKAIESALEKRKKLSTESTDEMKKLEEFKEKITGLKEMILISGERN